MAGILLPAVIVIPVAEKMLAKRQTNLSAIPAQVLGKIAVQGDAMPDDTQERQELFRLAAATDTGIDENGAYKIIPLSMVRGGVLKPTKVYLKPVKHIVNKSNPALRGWYKNRHTSAKVRCRPCFTEALLTTPMGGYCSIGCPHCYVDNGTRGYRATGIATANPEYPDYMRRQVATMKISPAAYMSSFTEPFQPLEDAYHITQRLTKVFTDANIPIFYLSRLLPPDWAVDALLENPYSYMQWSVNTSNDDDYKKLSPGSYHIWEVLKSVSELNRLGIYTSFQVNPVLPGITSLNELEVLVELAAQAGLKHVIFKFVEQVTGNRKLLLKRLAHIDDADKLDGYLTQVIGGVYTIREDLREEWLTQLLDFTREKGVTMSTCYEYWDKPGTAGANLGPHYTTSRGGCHGKSVPMHYRPEPGAKFLPLPGDFQSGCLYCQEFGTHVCRNSLLLEARALVAKDYKAIDLSKAADARNWKLEGSAPSPSKAKSFDNWFPNKQTFAEFYGMGPEDG